MFKWIRRSIAILLVLFVGYQLIQTHQAVHQVLRYRPLVREVLNEQDTPANEDLILAMIYTETKGRSADLMQSSESANGEKDSIMDSKESIRQGVQTLSDNLTEARERGVDQAAAVQAYNFGPAYLEYVEQNGKKNSLDLAKRYSKEVVAPSLGNMTGVTYTYLTPISIWHGGQLYRNGGNYYYADLVDWNLKLIQFFSKF